MFTEKKNSHLTLFQCLILLAILLLRPELGAAQSNVVLLGMGFGKPNYTERSYGFELGYGRILGHSFSVSLDYSDMTGFVKHKFVAEGLQNGIKWKYTYPKGLEERLQHGDISLLYAPWGYDRNFGARFGGGISLAKVNVSGPNDVLVRNGIVVREETIDKTFKTLMSHVVADFAIPVKYRVTIGLQAIVRFKVRDNAEDVFATFRSSDDFSISSTSNRTGLYLNTAMMLRIGYLF